jgi:ribosome recycling factor
VWSWPKPQAAYAEKARIAVRNVRRDGMDAAEEVDEKDNDISEDQHKKLG